MSWTAVNTNAWLRSTIPLPAIQKPDTDRQHEIPNQRIADSECQYRELVLCAAERLVKGRLKTRRVCTPKTKAQKIPKAYAAIPPSHNVVPAQPAKPIGQELGRKRKVDADLTAAQTARSLEIIEISSDDETSYSDHTMCETASYDDFDDNIFDEIVLNTHPIPETIQKFSPPAQTHLEALTHPNGSPFPPFLHPCLLDSVESEALLLNKRELSPPSLKHTCFRTAELLRLAKCLSHKHDPDDFTAKLEIFATVREVRYADHLGHGQGITFSDLFFPNKPPYITAMSRIPYNAKDLVSATQKQNDPRPVIKAILLLSLKPCVAPARSNAPAKPAPEHEVGEVRAMVEKDFKARCEGSRKSRITEYFPADKPGTTILSGHNREEITDEQAVAQLLEDLSDYEDGFSDADLSLPDVEELLKVH